MIWLNKHLAKVDSRHTVLTLFPESRQFTDGKVATPPVGTGPAKLPTAGLKITISKVRPDISRYLVNLLI